MITRRPHRHPQIHLPSLSPDYALTLVDVFERAIAAIWRAHGDGMAELRGLREANQHVACGICREAEYVEDGNPAAPDDTDF